MSEDVRRVMGNVQRLRKAARDCRQSGSNGGDNVTGYQIGKRIGALHRQADWRNESAQWRELTSLFFRGGSFGGLAISAQRA
jgi:hypothetical protein